MNCLFRRSLRVALFGGWLLLAGGCQSPSQMVATEDAEPTKSSTTPPNVLFILVDDLGWSDLGYSGSSFYETPHIDRLAASGTVFTNAYAACPVCSPTRASILAGKTPARMATTDWFGAPQFDAVSADIERGKSNRWTQMPLIGPNYVPQLPLEEQTLAEAFKEAGYATFFAGKWHLGKEGFGPTQQGFDVNVAGFHRGGPYGGGKYFHPFTGMPNLTSEPGDHLPARLAEETADFIEHSKDKPFLAYLSFYSVHTPLMGRPDLVAHYQELKSRMRIAGPLFGEEGERKVRWVQEHATYAAMVTAMDQAVGHVLDRLEEQGLAENTIVVFFADNGGLSTSEGSPTSNLPLRAGKGWLYEGGIREPCIVRWPNRKAAPSQVDTPILSTDFYPSLLEMCGLDAVPEQHVDGSSFAELLESGETAAETKRALFWHYPHYGNQGGSPGSAVRLGDWKLIRWYEPERAPELFNLAEDIGEQHNLAGREAEKLAELNRLLDAYLQESGARLPTLNSQAR